MIIFNEGYYQRVIKEHGYDPMEFRPIDFGLGMLEPRLLASKWLCHHRGDIFASETRKGNSTIVTTGFGLSGVPHVGTISQMLGAIALQRAGMKVQIVLGDLDAYNARSKDLKYTRDLAQQYREFILALGFSETAGILRTQYDHPEVLRTGYLIANCLSDRDFIMTEEDLSGFYKKMGVYPGIEFPVKQAILLMVADFIDLGAQHKFVLVMLGIDEHRYIRLARDVVERCALPMEISGLYSRMNRGLSNYPKMSKSIPGSAITADMSPGIIRDLVVHSEGSYEEPLDSVVYQMMCSTSYYSADELDTLYEACCKGRGEWLQLKESYAEMLASICAKWPR